MSTFKIRYRYELLDWDNNILDDLQGVTTGGHAQSSQATIHTSASLTIHDTGQVQNWADVKVKPWVTVNGDTWPLGVYIPSIPEWAYQGTVRTAQVVLTDKLSLLNTAYHRPTVWNPSAPVTAMIKAIIEGEHDEPVNATESGLVYPNGYGWEPGESQLHHFNDMLRGINYFSLWVDGNGVFQIHPYVEPSGRGITTRFVDGVDGVRLAGNSVYTPSFTLASDFETPNVYAAISQGDSENEGVYFEHRNMSLADPMSVPKRGRLVWPEGGVETNAQVATGELARYVRRRLTEVARSSTTVEIEHPPMRLAFNDVVEFESREHNISGVFTVERTDAQHQFDSMWRTRLRKVVTV